MLNHRYSPSRRVPTLRSYSLVYSLSVFIYVKLFRCNIGSYTSRYIKVLHVIAVVESYMYQVPAGSASNGTCHLLIYWQPEALDLSIVFYHDVIICPAIHVLTMAMQPP